ncbi:hypothetical protein CAL7716_059570 [Calothrix sp. PCC 7716]|nr:hypothetical protein CAL7716_059570 [Calothrix sp. PCC 7716]
MIFPFEMQCYCSGTDGKKYLVSTLWVEILQSVGVTERNKDNSDEYPPNLENIMEGIGCYDSEVILEYIEDLVGTGFLVVVGDCWYLTDKGSEFSPYTRW